MAHLANNAEAKTLWVGDIETWMDEASLANIFARSGAVANVKVIRDKKTGLSLGYGFVEFTNHKAAQEVLMTLNGSTVPGTNKKLKLNWGVMSTSNKTAQPTNQPTVIPNANLKAPTQAQTQSQSQQPGPEHSIYVGELSQSVDENVLVEFFSQRYRSITGAKIIVDPVTRQSKGYGFVKFSDPQEAQSAIREMQGILLRGRAIKTNQAHIKASSTDNTSNNLNQNLMLNPLLASLTAGGMPNAYGMMGTDNLAMANYAAQQNLQNAQMYQANYLGMQNLAMMPNLQGLQTLQANQALVNPAFGYPANLLAMQNQQGLLQNMQGGLNAMQPNQAFSNPNFNYSSNLAGGITPQNQQQQQLYQQQAYQQPQVMGAYNPQGTIPGYGTPQQGLQGVQMSPQQNPYYAQQGMMYQPQQQLQQQQYGYGIQVQTIPSQQQQQQQPQLYQGMPGQQNGNGNYQYQPTTPQKQQPLISPTQLNQRFPSQQGQGQKPVQQSPKNQNIGNSPLLSIKNVNTLLPSSNKPFGDQQYGGLNAIIPGLNIESAPQGSGHNMEEEKEEDSMVFNPGFIETNFRFDFISSEKMTNIL